MIAIFDSTEFSVFVRQLLRLEQAEKKLRQKSASGLVTIFYVLLS